MICDGWETERDAYTPQEFCYRHGITPNYLKTLWRRGQGPDVMVVGNQERISREAAARWRRERETQKR